MHILSIKSYLLKISITFEAKTGLWLWSIFRVSNKSLCNYQNCIFYLAEKSDFFGWQLWVKWRRKLQVRLISQSKQSISTYDATFYSADSLKPSSKIEAKSYSITYEKQEFMIILTRRLSEFKILNNATLICQKWLLSRHFANIFHYLNFSEEYLWQFS